MGFPISTYATHGYLLYLICSQKKISGLLWIVFSCILLAFIFYRTEAIMSMTGDATIAGDPYHVKALLLMLSCWICQTLNESTTVSSMAYLQLELSVPNQNPCRKTCLLTRSLHYYSRRKNAWHIRDYKGTNSNQAMQNKLHYALLHMFLCTVFNIDFLKSCL